MLNKKVFSDTLSSKARQTNMAGTSYIAMGFYYGEEKWGSILTAAWVDEIV